MGAGKGIWEMERKPMIKTILNRLDLLPNSAIFLVVDFVVVFFIHYTPLQLWNSHKIRGIYLQGLAPTCLIDWNNPIPHSIEIHSEKSRYKLVSE